MSIKYDSNRESLVEIIRQATDDATLVIPDLQRPYVWTPRQVILLIDSLFRGWPFGSLLLWEVKPDCFPPSDGIPHRGFWHVVDRVDGDDGSAASMMAHPATYKMVLDGQQRVQSLVLALGGDKWGFKLTDADWAADRQDRRMKETDRWYLGSLCLDLDAFNRFYQSSGRNVRRMEMVKVLDWVVVDPDLGQAPGQPPANYISPINSSFQNAGKYIRLSRLWKLAVRGTSEDEYEIAVERVLEEHSVPGPLAKELIKPLRQFQQLLEGVKYDSSVHTLKIDSFSPTPQWTRDDYSEAIVSIFTRLNTAGRTLSTEDITLAWLKVGWVASEAGGRDAGACLDELASSLREEMTEENATGGLKPSTDDIVRLVSFVWAIDHRNGSILDAKDLLKGEVVRPMARSVAGMWVAMTECVIDGVKLLSARDLIRNVGSFNAVIVLVTWYRIVYETLRGFRLQVVRSDELEKFLYARVSQFSDRWIFASQWAGFWGDHAPRNFQDIATILSSCADSIRASSPDNFVAKVDDSIVALMERVQEKAIAGINSLAVSKRTRVSQYYSSLWVWHRLDRDRWASSSITLRTGRKRTHKLEVDHTVADKWWERATKSLTENKRANFSGPSEDKVHIVAGDFSSEQEALSFINLLGNCSLLDKSFNISKSDKPMWDFMKDVKEFKENPSMRESWEKGLGLTGRMTVPAEDKYQAIVGDIIGRDALIRKDLIGFVQGALFRVDVEHSKPQPDEPAIG